MVQALLFLEFTLNLMLCAASGTTNAGFDSTMHFQSLAPASSTTLPTTDSVIFLCITIGNRMFDESLSNQSSENYKELRGELTQLLDEVYSSEPYNYSGMSAITFSKGSVVANSTIVFKTAEINSSVVNDLFIRYVQTNPPPNLNLSIPNGQGIANLEHQENTLTGVNMIVTTPSLKTAPETTLNHGSASSSGITNTKPAISETPHFTPPMSDTTHFHIGNITTIGSLMGYASSTTLTTNSALDATLNSSKSSTESLLSQLTTTKASTATSPPPSGTTINHFTNLTLSLGISVSSTRTMSFPSSSTTSLSETSSSRTHNNSPTVHPPISAVITTVISSSHNTAFDSTDIVGTGSLGTTHSPPLSNTTDHPINGTLNTSDSSTAMFARTSTPNSTSLHPNPASTAQHASSLPSTTASVSSTPEGKATRSHATRSTLGKRTSPTSTASTSTTQGPFTTTEGTNSKEVPGWAISLLVLASLILFFLILLFIALLVYWCCKRRQYDFMNMSEDPGVFDQVNHGADIPMYITHSHFESTNGKPYDDTEKPMKTRAMYTVNK